MLCPIVVGRDEELATLDAALEAALGGKGRLACLTGEAGIGKSRLAREVAAMARERGALVAVGRGVPSGATTPYRPLTEALLSCLRDRPLPSDPDLAPWLPALGAIVPTLAPGARVETSPPVRAEAVIQLLRRLAPTGGLVVVLEDLHWADPDTLAVVEYLGDNLGGAPVLCVATCRSEVPSAADATIRRLVGSRTALHVPLGRLEAALVSQMVHACRRDADDGVVTRVQAASDGIPFLVEEVLVSPGVPASFRETVRARIADFPDEERLVLSTAAILGRHFDWHLVVGATDRPPGVVTRALERGVDHQLLEVDGERFSFRHALTREAIVERLLPQRRRDLAAAALQAVDDAHRDLDGTWRDLAADLALQAGDERRAAALRLVSGRSAMERGALATAVDALGQAYRLDCLEAGPFLVEALALAGRVDEAVEIGQGVIARADRPRDGAGVYLLVAHAAIAADRWHLAAENLKAAALLLASDEDAALEAAAAVLEAEVALAGDDDDRAGRLAEAALSSVAAGPEVRCQALEVLGRVARFSDLRAARARFEQALSVAQDHDLPLWQVRAMHEIGTIDLFDHAGTERLLEARRTAGECGALSTAAVLDLQLSAAGHCRYELDMAAAHARSALALSEQLALGQIRAKALAMLAENAAWRGDPSDMERFIGLATAAAPGDPMLAGFAWGARGMRELLHGDRTTAAEHLDRATLLLAELPHAEPACFRAMWPVLLASVGDGRAVEAVAEARRLGVGAIRFNSGLFTYAEGIIAGRNGDPATARRMAASTEADFVNCRTWADVARWLAAESASGGGWDQPEWWLTGVGDRLSGCGLQCLADRCRELVGGPQRWAGLGITAREADVLNLVVEGLANKEIAAQLGLSPRTVEKHVEALLRKLDARSRTQLAAVAEARRSRAPT
ncbi:MAG: ATP-binding protein [Acidimicrobiales bacterium]